MKRIHHIVAAALAAALLAPGAGAVDWGSNLQELNYYEWIAVAPVVVGGVSLGENGRYVEFRVTHVLRGDVQPDDVLRVDLKRANRERRRSDYPRPLRLPEQERLLLVLEAPFSTGDGRAFPLARGVRSARELPLESQEGLIEALSAFVEIQAFRDDRVTWDRFAALLEETNPLLVRTALEQFLKFRRGEPQVLFSLRPLLDHPQPEIRELAAALVGQIVERHPTEEIREPDALLAELIGVARRDETVGVRVAATRALAGFGPRRVERTLTEVAERDPDQHVRYAAERVLQEFREELASEARRPRLEADPN